MWQEWTTIWWAWIVFGFVLGVAEVLIPGFIFLGFAIGAVFTGILVGIGMAPASLSVLILVFAVTSVLGWLALRRYVGVREGQIKLWHKDINDN